MALRQAAASPLLKHLALEEYIKASSLVEGSASHYLPKTAYTTSFSPYMPYKRITPTRLCYNFQNTLRAYRYNLNQHFCTYEQQLLFHAPASCVQREQYAQPPLARCANSQHAAACVRVPLLIYRSVVQLCEGNNGQAAGVQSLAHEAIWSSQELFRRLSSNSVWTSFKLGPLKPCHSAERFSFAQNASFTQEFATL